MAHVRQRYRWGALIARLSILHLSTSPPHVEFGAVRPVISRGINVQTATVPLDHFGPAPAPFSWSEKIDERRGHLLLTAA